MQSHTEHLLFGIMHMDDRTWRRHASAWSVCTRGATLPPVVLAIGRRVWLARRETPIPRHHEQAARILSRFTATGASILAAGLIWLHAWTTALGAAVCMLAKLWFCDRKVWLYEDMKYSRPEYRAWLTSPRTSVGSTSTPPVGDEPAR